jgi:hypothetical protein
MRAKVVPLAVTAFIVLSICYKTGGILGICTVKEVMAEKGRYFDTVSGGVEKLGQLCDKFVLFVGLDHDIPSPALHCLEDSRPCPLLRRLEMGSRGLRDRSRSLVQRKKPSHRVVPFRAGRPGFLPAGIPGINLHQDGR